MNENKAWFDSHDLSTLFKVAPPERNLVTWEPTLIDSPRYGAIAAGTKAQPLQIALTLTTFADTLEGRLADLHTLAGWLAVDEPKELVLTDERPYYPSTWNSRMLRFALPTGTPQITYAHNAASAKVTFVCPDARGYATDGEYDPSIPFPSRIDQRTEFVTPISSSHVVTLRGTAPTEASIEIVNAQGNSNGVFEMRFRDTGTNSSSCITLPISASEQVDVVLDCENRTLTIDGVQVFNPLVDWMRFKCGSSYEVSCTKGDYGNCQITYFTRWW